VNRETGGYLDWGVPAPVLAEFLRERGIIPEKNDLNTILFLVTPGIEVSKAGTLVYPPGIGVVVPGERHDERAEPMIAYLKLFEASYARFPGFENEIQGVFPEQGRSHATFHIRHQGTAKGERTADWTVMRAAGFELARW
jgi:arginine/lysine/ornithine decarboxylase